VAIECITTDAAEIARGNIYLPRAICDAYFAGISSVALIVREGAIQIVPLSRDSAGGLLLKQRNARGDRVVHAQEFMREKGYPELFEPRTVAVRWNGDLAALSIEGYSPACDAP
jgi:hypothetical protein